VDFTSRPRRAKPITVAEAERRAALLAVLAGEACDDAYGVRAALPPALAARLVADDQGICSTRCCAPSRPPGPRPTPQAATASRPAPTRRRAGSPIPSRCTATLPACGRTCRVKALLPVLVAVAVVVAPAPRAAAREGAPVPAGGGALHAAIAADDAGAGPVTTVPATGSALDDLAVTVRTDLLAVDPGLSQVRLAVDGRAVPVRVTDRGRDLRVTAVDLPDDLRAAPAQAGPSTVTLLAAVRPPVPGPVRHVSASFTWHRAPPPPPATAEGFALVPGDGPVVGTGGPVTTYSLEVEPGTAVDPHAFAAEAEGALSDPRGWTARGERRLQRVGREDADIRVLVATPATVDRYCAQAGLDTAGRYSCWNGRFALLNADRWNGGAAAFTAPLAEYRAYVVNHEVGHGLGHGHAACPGPGAPAPVMLQQTIRVAPCHPNPWPHP